MPMWDSEEVENFAKAGKILAKVREDSKGWIKPGLSLLEIAERIEGEIRKAGAEIAFPANLSRA